MHIDGSEPLNSLKLSNLLLPATMFEGSGLSEKDLGLNGREEGIFTDVWPPSEDKFSDTLFFPKISFMLSGKLKERFRFNVSGALGSSFL